MSAVTVDGVALEVVDHPAGVGAAGRPPLVFLHEGLGSIELWRSFPDAVRAAAGTPRMVVYSRAGYGRSGPVARPRPVTYMHHEADVVLPSLLAALGIVRPLLVGHSDGASIALLYAGAGHDVAGLVLLAPHVFVEDVSVTSIAAAREAYASSDLRAKLARYHDDVDGAFRGWNDVWLDPTFRAWDITDRLGAITAPALVIQGDGDPYGTAAQVDAISAGVSGAVTTVLLAGIGHAPHLEAAEETLAAATAYLERVSGGWTCA